MAATPSIQSISETTEHIAEAAKEHGIRKLYNHSTDRSARSAKWSEFEDLILEEKHLRERGMAYPIIHRFSRADTPDGDVSWATHSIEIQSPRLKAIFDRVFAGYPGWYPDAAPYTFFPPFKPLVHRWEAILQAFEQAEAGDCQLTKDEIQHLRQVLEPLLSTHLSALNRAKETLVTSFEQLWLFLAPGSLMFTTEQGSPCVMRLLSVTFVPEQHGFQNVPAYWILVLGQYDWNGSYCGLRGVQKKITQFKEDTLVTKFDVYPLEFVSGREKIEQALLSRGEKWSQLRGMHVKNCVGKKYVRVVGPSGCMEEVAKPISGRVIVDAFGYYKGQGHILPKLSRHSLKVDVELSDSDDYDQDNDNDSDDNGSDDGENAVELVKDDLEREEEMNTLSPEECILAAPRVRGFDLRAKEWCLFDVDDIQDTTWDEMPYEKLVLPGGEKEKKLILGFAKHRAGKKGFDDFVRQKGKGIIILLCGPPGVGKTLTAEAVAEKSRTPIYVLSASDLGTNPAKVDAALTEALECCQLWNAALLLDEADVFLECRGSNSLDRNELVSIFLRRLEYYQGLMFLTTNRLSAIDPAFKSRLDLILPYHDLTEESRRDVWKNFIGLLPHGTARIANGDFDELAKTEMNGREIKNSIKTSLVLVEDGDVLSMEHLRVVLNIRKRIAAVQDGI